MHYYFLLLLTTSPIALARVAPEQPVITPAPSLAVLELRRRQDEMNLASLAQVLLTAVPPSILDLALTNVPAVSRLLWSEFLDSNTPAWFTALPSDIQKYLSGEFGPTTVASNTASATLTSSGASTTSSRPTASETALNNQSDNSRTDHNGGLPLWAKIVIGIAVPLIVIGLIALILLCCLRRRRHRKRSSRAETSRAPTPAFISSSYREQPAERPVEHVPLRGGYLSSPDTSRHTPNASPHHSSDSEEYRTPIGGPSYEDIPLPPAVGMQHSNRGSRQSFNSLHSVPEVPEPIHDRHHGAIGAPPPRSPRRSRDLSQEQGFNNSPAGNNGRRISPLNPLYNSNGGLGDRGMQASPYTAGQGIYAGGHNPYHPYDADYRHDNPFTDPSPPRPTGHMASGGYRGVTDHDSELFMPGHGDRRRDSEYDDHESNWPLRALHESGYETVGRPRKSSWERGDDRPVYEM